MTQVDKSDLHVQAQLNSIVDRIVAADRRADEAEYKAKVEKLQPPESTIVTVDRMKLIEGLKRTEADVLQKHKEAVEAWQKAVKNWKSSVNRNPGQHIQHPGPRPDTPDGLENIRALVRAYECLVELNLRLTRQVLVETFKTSHAAVADMRAVRDQFMAYNAASGNTTMSASNFAGLSVSASSR